MNWANLLTALRLAAAPVAGWSTAGEHWLAALLLWLVAIVTDVFDGILARRFGAASSGGGLFDHGTDCAFVTFSLGGLASAGWVPWLLPILVPLAFLQYALDSRALAGRPLRTNRIGKSNGIGYFAVAGVVIVPNALGWGDWLPTVLGAALAWLLAATTLLSMGERLLLTLRGYWTKQPHD
ncbi:MAG: CDP-alcohol phosphatidyltransferase family protein [Gammaproteobacteria bacterium]|nr:CDP-alcohol phosphatidyltransferase family protein [Gammaproteobacteria bacterium]